MSDDHTTFDPSNWHERPPVEDVPPTFAVGVDLPDDDTVIAHPTYASWRTSPTEEVPHGDR